MSSTDKHLRPGRPPRGLKQAGQWYAYAVMGYSWIEITRRWAWNQEDVAYVVIQAERWAILYEQPWPPCSPVTMPQKKKIKSQTAEAAAEEGPAAPSYEPDLDPKSFLFNP
tara:strand:+ start:109 stop:441 length:333 start_codon:yes stop_codon:yes gene_type:complete